MARRGRRQRVGKANRWGMLPLAVALVLTGSGCGGDEKEKELTVSAASSLSEALSEYSDSVGFSVRLSFGGSDQLAAQIRHGAKPDLFASADAAYPAALHQESLVKRPVTFARNRLVLVSSADQPPTLADLTQSEFAIVIGDPNVPVGSYAREALSRLPPEIEAKVLANVRSEEPEASSVLTKVVSGAADVGIVYATDAATVEGQVQVTRLPDRLQPRIVYAAAILVGSPREQMAARFLDGLLTKRGTAILQRHGFLAP
jgi:molybdate transport system substrate-binding protein